MADFGAYGVVQASATCGTHDEFSGLIEEISVRGFASYRGLLSGEEVDRLNQLMDDIYTRQCADAGGADQLGLINDADIARCLLAYHDAFMALARHPVLTGLAQAMIGENVVLLMQNGVLNRPGQRQAQARWHRDLNYQHWTSSRPLAVSALVCLEDFGPETGGTSFLPGSHLMESFPSRVIVEQGEVTPVLPRGSVILFNSMVFHRAGTNRSSRVRRAVNHVIGAPILAQQVDIPAMLDRPAPEDPWLAGYLGYRWNPTRDVSSWRKQRIQLARQAAV